MHMLGTQEFVADRGVGGISIQSVTANRLPLSLPFIYPFFPSLKYSIRNRENSFFSNGGDCRGSLETRNVLEIHPGDLCSRVNDGFGRYLVHF